MPTFTPFYVEPGAYPKYEPAEAFPVVPGGVRVLALIGAGKDTKDIEQEAVTKGAANGQDALDAVATVISRVFTDTVEYEEDLDYQLTAGEVDWSLVIQAALTSGEEGPYDLGYTTEATPVAKTLIITVDGGSAQVITFAIQATPANYSAQDIVDAITAQATGVTASVVTVGLDEYVKIESDATNGSSLVIGNGTANDALGLSDGLADEGSKEPAVASEYYVNYTRAKITSEYTPLYWFSMNAIISEFGEATTANPIALAAQIAFENGASIWLMAQTDPADGSEYDQFVAALAKLEQKDCNVVVPVSSNENLFSIVKSHVENMSTQLERKWRIAFLGLQGTKTVSEMNTLATGLNSRRVILAYPETLTRVLGGVETDINGEYLAAALGGISVNPNLDVATPLTRRDVSGFTNLSGNINLRTEKNLIASNGVCIIDFDGVNAIVRHGKTTAIDTVINQEISLTTITDYVAEVVFRVLENVYVGKKIVTNTPIKVNATTQSVLNQLVEQDILVSFQNIQVEQNGTDPTQIDVAFEISPVYPLNYVDIRFTIST